MCGLLAVGNSEFRLLSLTIIQSEAFDGSQFLWHALKV